MSQPEDFHVHLLEMLQLTVASDDGKDKEKKITRSPAEAAFPSVRWIQERSEVSMEVSISEGGTGRVRVCAPPLLQHGLVVTHS